MTYGVFKNITSGLLIGDRQLPTDADVLLGLVQYALTTVATSADSLHLMTLNSSGNILRLGQGDYLVRTPNVPVEDTDILDIDEELVFAVARYVASYISAEKGGIHVNEAVRIIKNFNAKTWEIIEQVKLETLKNIENGEVLPEIPSECGTADTTFNPSCEFTL